MAVLSWPLDLLHALLNAVKDTPAHFLFFISLSLTLVGLLGLYVTLHLVAPKPRQPFPAEKTYLTSSPRSKQESLQLPCWFDKWLAQRQLSEAARGNGDFPDQGIIEPAEVEMTVVVPAYNEELRILPALREMVEYCDARFGRPSHPKEEHLRPKTPTRHRSRSPVPVDSVSGYEILIINDGSTDKTVDVVLEFSRKQGLHDIIRIVTLEKNRGKGGGVTHGFRHARGAYVAFADADGASRFSDLGKLIEGCDEVLDTSDRGVAIGSRGHLVGSEAVVKRSAIRNFLMRSFHFVLMILTPPATSRIHDTQCGFKLFTRAALPHIIPYMHSEGWIFDIEMLMLAESAPATPVYGSAGTVIGTSPGIKVAEVPIDWHEVEGSKMNLIQDSIRMAVGLTVLRASWMMGVYRRRLT